MSSGYSPFNAFGSFDFTSPTSPEEEEEERRRREGMFAPAGGDEAEAMLTSGAPPVEAPPEGVEDYGVVQAPEIRGMEPSPTAAHAEQYKEWMSRMPTREETEPSTKRKILGGLAGFLAGMGGGAGMAERTTSGILEGPRRRAMSDWQEEGAALKDVGTYVTTAAETERKGRGDVMRLEGINRRVTAARESIAQRETAENQRHADREAAQLTDSEKAAETQEHNDAMEAIAQERNRIDEIFSSAATSRAESAAITAERGPAPTKLGGYTDLSNAMMDSLKEMMAIYPGMTKFFRTIGDRDVVLKKGLDLSADGPDQAELDGYLKDAKEPARKRLESLQRDDVEPFLRQGVQ